MPVGTIIPGLPYDPNLQDVDRGPALAIVISVFTALMIFFTFLRIGTKLYVGIKMTTSDYFCIVTFFLNLTTSALEFKSVEYGFGRHIQFLPLKEINRFRLSSELVMFFAGLALWSIKVCICFFILEILQRTHKILRWATYAQIVIATLGTISQAVSWGFQAHPLRKLWDPEIAGTYAPRSRQIDIITIYTVVMSITDLFYAIAPIYFLARVKTDMKRKLCVIGLMATGVIIFAISITRLFFMKDILNFDSTWALMRLYITVVVERNLGAIIACLPAMLPFFKFVVPKICPCMSQPTTASEKSNEALYQEAGSARKPRSWESQLINTGATESNFYPERNQGDSTLSFSQTRVGYGQHDLEGAAKSINYSVIEVTTDVSVESHPKFSGENRKADRDGDSEDQGNHAWSSKLKLRPYP